MNSPKEDFKHLLKFLFVYQSKKTATFAKNFEHFKNLIVEALMLKRGKYQKHIWHGSMLVLCLIALITSGTFGNNSVVASSFPGSGIADPRDIETFDPNASGITLENLIHLKTFVSQKPRSDDITYEVKRGDTLSTIADKYGISTSTIKWANDLTSDYVKPGDKLKILPVSGVEVTVKSGDTLQSIAKKYQADAQAILDYPFNDVPDDQKLTTGQTLIVPDGAPPNSVAPKPKAISPSYLAQGSQSNSPAFSAPGGGSFIWPTHSVGISQYFAWYHPGLDLPNNAEPPVVASSGGKVVYAGWDTTGYGNRVDIDHGNGYLTRYAHLSNIFVGLGQVVSQGQTIGIN